MPLVSAFATSHAYTFQEPETWDARRARSKANVERKAGLLYPRRGEPLVSVWHEPEEDRWLATVTVADGALVVATGRGASEIGACRSLLHAVRTAH